MLGATGPNCPKCTDSPGDTPFGIVRLCLRRVEDSVLAGLLATMIVVAVMRIIQRNFTGGGPAWADELLRVLVLWLGMFGAMAASREANHINIDLVSRMVPDRMANLAQALAALFTAVVCGLAAWYGYSFVMIEHEFGSKILGSTPAWAVQIIIPVAFGLIGVRYLTHFVERTMRAVKGDPK